MSNSNRQIIVLDSVDSTNNYAMGLISGNKAQHGMTIAAMQQTNGKGQRGREWVDVAGESMLMSVIIEPQHTLAEQFLFNATVSVAIANVLRKLSDRWQVAIKWPNDIIVNDKKAGGVLIENVLSGSRWTHSVVGFGLNVNQAVFTPELPFATSLRAESGVSYDLPMLLNELSGQIIEKTSVPLPGNEQMRLFNDCLYKRGKAQTFADAGHTWLANIINAQADGTLQVQREDGKIECYVHGHVTWVYGG